MKPIQVMRLSNTVRDSTFANNALLLQCDGSNGGILFPDNSPTPNVVTPTICTTSTTQAKFGPSSCFFPSANPTEKLLIPHSAALSPLGDFTVEFFLYLTASLGSAFRALIWKSVSSGHTPYAMRLVASSSPRITMFASNTAGSALAVNATGGIVLSHNAWTHVAMTRSGSTYRLFIGGVLDATGTNAGAGYFNAAHSVCIGNVSDNIYPLGFEGNAFMDAIRIKDGVALYTANFTPPSRSFPNS